MPSKFQCSTVSCVSYMSSFKTQNWMLDSFLVNTLVTIGCTACVGFQPDCVSPVSCPTTESCGASGDGF